MVILHTSENKEMNADYSTLFKCLLQLKVLLIHSTKNNTINQPSGEITTAIYYILLENRPPQTREKVGQNDEMCAGKIMVGLYGWCSLYPLCEGSCCCFFYFLSLSPSLLFSPPPRLLSRECVQYSFIHTVFPPPHPLPYYKLTNGIPKTPRFSSQLKVPEDSP